MIKRLISAALCLALMLGMCGCAAIFEKEYLLVEDYVPAVQGDNSQLEKLTVHNLYDLKQAIRGMVNSGQTSGSVIFDSAYEGDVAEDLSNACWQVRTQDALCAYCVVNIFYELNKIVAYYEAQINIIYSGYGEKVENIAVLPYSTGADTIIRTLLSEGSNRGAVLINQSSLSAQEMEDLVVEVYRRDPAIAPRLPLISVNMYTGTNQQRLYEINLAYSMGSEELKARKTSLALFAPFESMDTSRLSEGRRALLAFEYVMENISVDPPGQNNTIYSALINNHADSEGIALAFVELCRQLNVECRIVYGQRNWQDHCWNIVRLGQSYYHVDAALERELPIEECFMRRDEQLWESSRWDMASYPSCTGLLSYADVLRGRDIIPVETDKIHVETAAGHEEGSGVEEVKHNALVYHEMSGKELSSIKGIEYLLEKDKHSKIQADELPETLEQLPQNEAEEPEEPGNASSKQQEAESSDQAQ